LDWIGVAGLDRNGLVVWAAFSVTAVGLAAAPSPASKGRLVVTPPSPVVGVRTTVEFHAPRSASRQPSRLVLTVAPDTGNVFRLRMHRVTRALWRSSFAFPFEGGWSLRVNKGSKVLATRMLAVRLPAATTFAPPGQLGCAPASPANPATREARGTASTGDLWARFFARLAGGHSAILNGILGKETKIVWRLQGSGEADFTAITPSGRELRPAWVSRHEGSSWTRPGDEWGTGFVFSETGCWQIRVQRDDVRGDLLLVVSS
jgi:hypothetical protein